MTGQGAPDPREAALAAAFKVVEATIPGYTSDSEAIVRALAAANLLAARALIVKAQFDAIDAILAAARQRPTAPPEDRVTAAEEALCSQCGEMPSVMVKVGTDDGWCVDCLDRAAATPEAGIKALRYAADEMEAVIADGDVAEVAAPVPGEVGRATCIERRDFLLEDPVDWLRAYATALEGAAREDNGGAGVS